MSQSSLTLRNHNFWIAGSKRQEFEVVNRVFSLTGPVDYTFDLQDCVTGVVTHSGEAFPVGEIDTLIGFDDGTVYLDGGASYAHPPTLERQGGYFFIDRKRSYEGLSLFPRPSCIPGLSLE